MIQIYTFLACCLYFLLSHGSWGENVFLLTFSAPWLSFVCVCLSLHLVFHPYHCRRGAVSSQLSEIQYCFCVCVCLWVFIVVLKISFCFLSHLSSFSSQYASPPPFPLSCLPPEVVYHVSMCYSSPSLWCHLIKIICLVFTPPSEHEYISLRLSVKVCVVWQMKLHSSSCSVQSGVTCSGPLALLHCLWRSVYAVFLCLNTPPRCLLNC